MFPRFSHPFARSDEALNVKKQATDKQLTVSLPSVTPNGSSDDLGAKENGLYWEGYLEEEYIDKMHAKPIRNLRYMFFSIYRRLFGITFAANMSVFIALTATHQANTGKIAYAVISNIFVSILMRQEYVINTLFNIFTAWPQSAPLTIRRISARIFHIGGRKCSSALLPCHQALTYVTTVHSGCGISATIWLILFVAMGTREYIHGLSPVRVLH